jgi:lipopolysaccharide/colanic/teichoic acid biosynthesis glycosyltransferase
MRRKSTTSLSKGRVVSEIRFAEAMCLERKRSERSSRTLLLMLADFTAFLETREHGTPVHHIASELVHHVRDTDIVGWQKDGVVLGIIFTELGNASKEEVAGAIRQRMNAALQALTDSRAIPLALHFFPEEYHDDENPMDRDVYPDLLRPTPMRKMTQAMKRTIDVTGSGSGILFLLPLLLVISLLIRLTSKGPVLYRQIRLGQNGRAFPILKFRTMYLNNDDRTHRDYINKFIAGVAEANHAKDARHAAYKLVDDARITPLGRWLRRTSIDELPQLINVLIGEMSLVGPRPPLPYEFHRYEIWHRRRVLEMKPGMTGLWQVSGRTRTNFAEMVRMDLRYGRQWSLWLDLKILFRTPRVVLLGDGAY